MGEDRTEKTKVENIWAVVAGGHHADGDAYAHFAGLIGGDEVAGTEQIVVSEVDCILLRTVHLRGDLHSEVGLVFTGEHAVGHLVQNLGELGCVVLAHGKNDGLPDLAANGVAQGVFDKGLAEDLIGRGRKEALLEFALLVGFLLVVALVVLKLDDKPVVRQKLGGDFGPGINDGRLR